MLKLSSNLIGHINAFNSTRSVTEKLINANFAKRNQLYSQVTSSEDVSQYCKEKHLELLRRTVTFWFNESRHVPPPQKILPDQWEVLLTLKSKSSKRKYLLHLWRMEMKQKITVKRAEFKELRKEQFLKLKAEESHILYGFGHNSMFLRIWQRAEDNWLRNKLMRAMQFGQKVVLDCGYDPHMVRWEAKKTGGQLFGMFSQNVRNIDPFDIHFCNVNFEGNTFKELRRMMTRLEDPSFPVNLHAKCFTEVFPKEKLVYLSPHCTQDLTHYDPDDIYIIGAYVDRARSKQVSLPKARSLGVRTARLPLVQHLNLDFTYKKLLTIDQVLNILLVLKNNGTWEEALKGVKEKVLQAKKKRDHFDEIRRSRNLAE